MLMSKAYLNAIKSREIWSNCSVKLLKPLRWMSVRSQTSEVLVVTKGKVKERHDPKQKHQERMQSQLTNAFQNFGEKASPIDVLHLALRPDPIISARKCAEVETDLKTDLRNTYPDVYVQQFGSQMTGTAFEGELHLHLQGTINTDFILRFQAATWTFTSRWSPINHQKNPSIY